VSVEIGSGLPMVPCGGVEEKYDIFEVFWLGMRKKLLYLLLTSDIFYKTCPAVSSTQQIPRKIVNSDVEAVTSAALRKKKTSSSCLLVSIRAFVSSTQCSTRDLPHNSYQIDHESIQPKTKHQSPYSLRTSTQG
jgi:hypothetical protein